MPFLLPNQQRQSTDGQAVTSSGKKTRTVTKVSNSDCKAGVNFLNLGSVNNSEMIPRHFSNVCESV